MFKALRDPKRLLLLLILLGLCAPLGMAIVQEGRRLFEDGILGTDLTGVVPAKLGEELKSVETTAKAVSTRSRILAAVVCVPDEFTPPSSVEKAQDKELLAKVAPRAATLADVKALFAACRELRDVKTAVGLTKWPNPFDSSKKDRLHKAVEQFRGLVELELQIRYAASEGASALPGWEKALLKYRLRSDRDDYFYRAQLPLLFKAKYRPPELLKTLRAALDREKADKDLARLSKEVQEFDTFVEGLGDAAPTEGEVAKLRTAWKNAEKLLRQRVEADRLASPLAGAGSAPFEPRTLVADGHEDAVKELISQLNKLATDEDFAMMRPLVVKVVLGFCERYLPRDLPLSKKVEVITNPMKQEYEPRQREQIRINWSGSKKSVLLYSEDAKKNNYSEFTFPDWKGYVYQFSEGGEGRGVGLRPSVEGLVREAYTARRSGGKSRLNEKELKRQLDERGLGGLKRKALWTWGPDTLKQMREDFLDYSNHLGPCWNRLGILAEALPEGFEDTKGSKP
jgi:hypothetical protein